MTGLTSFRSSVVAIGGIGLAHKGKKSRFNIGKFGGCTATTPEIWLAALTVYSA